jgi:8-hydroxy-5-deazaflavin:NADPH oxidoreductase
MKIGIIGSGQVGQVLAKAFVTEGHQVTLGTRNTAKPEVIEFAAANTNIATADFATTAATAELIVIATKGAATEEAIKLAGIENFTGKVVIDTTNPIAAAAPDDGVLKYFTTLEASLMEQLQTLLPKAKLVKAFNSVGAHFMYKPNFKEGTPTMFICGNDEDAKKTVTSLLTSFGWETADMGNVKAARAIEPLCILWCLPGFTLNQWNHAFKLLKA